MDRQTENQKSGIDLAKGLPMMGSADPQALEQERQTLKDLKTRGFLKRWRGYYSLTGPGWLQSALMLGSGSAMASLFAGAYLEYRLLWVQPLAMLLGLIMLMAISQQTLATQQRPFGVIKKYIHPVIAWLWAFGALAVTVIWHFPQYALAAGMTQDMVQAFTGWQPGPRATVAFLIGVGLLLLCISTIITWNYSSGHKGVRLYEKMLKLFVWMIIITFAVVVVRQALRGQIAWGRLFRGFLPLDIPRDQRGFSIVMGAFSAAVGINSTFLLPYTLLARNWGKEHKGLSKFDLFTGSFLPFCVVTSLVVIAAGCTIYDPEKFSQGATVLTPTHAAAMFESAGLNKYLARLIFGFGIIGMALSTITVHMLMSGFAICELFGVEPGGWKYRLACLLPAPAMTGVIFWKWMGPWIAVPASAICGLLLPFAYLIFFLLQNNKNYWGLEKPVGLKALV